MPPALAKGRAPRSTAVLLSVGLVVAKPGCAPLYAHFLSGAAEPKDSPPADLSSSSGIDCNAATCLLAGAVVVSENSRLTDCGYSAARFGPLWGWEGEEEDAITKRSCVVYPAA
ncbi:hypothetical protein PGQ11_010632 [Apiospora arundinis]|uniref:Uncharacterized protein n=1 Tax=Apiospora arundinis TaxID=335852 RepID=A0ABR2IA88_9PEZI